MHVTRQYRIETSAGSIAVKDRGGFGETPVLFLHGSSFSKDVFRDQFADATLSHFRLIAIDLPGHGMSDNAVNPDRTYTVGGLAGVVAEIIRRLDLSDCIVAGWSLGGHVAFELVGAVDQISGLFVFGAPPVPRGILGLVRGFNFSLDMLLASKAKMTPADARKFERITIGARSDGAFVDDILRTDERLRPAIARDMISGKGCNPLDALQSGSTPICLVLGDADPLIRTGYVESVRGASLYDGACKTIRNAGHAPFVDQPSVFNALLRDFVSDVTSGANLASKRPALRAAG